MNSAPGLPAPCRRTSERAAPPLTFHPGNRTTDKVGIDRDSRLLAGGSACGSRDPGSLTASRHPISRWNTSSVFVVRAGEWPLERLGGAQLAREFASAILLPRRSLQLSQTLRVRNEFQGLVRNSLSDMAAAQKQKPAGFLPLGLLLRAGGLPAEAVSWSFSGLGVRYANSFSQAEFLTTPPQSRTRGGGRIAR